MLNSFTAVGRLTRDPELRYTNSGIAVANGTLAVDRDRHDRDGNKVTDFFNLVVWNAGNWKRAENFSSWMRKGSLMAVTGRLETRSYENQQGQNVHVVEVNVESFDNLTPRNEQPQQDPFAQGQQAQPAPRQQAPVPQQNNYTPPAQKASQAPQQQAKPADPFANPDPFANNGKLLDISDDDLPF